MEQVIDPSNIKSNRPNGVWILTIYAIVFAGVLPIIATVYLMVSGVSPTEFGSSTTSLIVGILLGIGVIVSAIGAWKGNNKARIALMILITLHYVLIAINNANILSAPNTIPSELQARMRGRVFRGFLYPAIYIWYFLRAETRKFYVSAVSKPVE